MQKNDVFNEICESPMANVVAIIFEVIEDF